VLCPSKEEIEQFLAYSLQLESQLLPHFHESPWGTQMQEAEFWKNVNKKKYCWIDTETVLHQEHWNHFLATYQNPLGSF
jgi:hypothetical protein